MHKSQSLFNLTTALHVSVVTITHLQEHKTTVTTAYGNRYTVLLFAAIVDMDSNRQQYGVTVTICCSYSCFVLLKMGDIDTRNM
jgi:translation elongation factor EF-Tu-like GTPase